MKIIDNSPQWAKAGYVALMHHLKAALKLSGALDKLDEKAKNNRSFHYLRSLLAIHNVSDMVMLDVPWWTYTAIDAVLAHLQGLERPIKVFEWGSGASTVWLAKRADKVVTIEHDAKWYALLQPILSSYSNIQLKLIEPEDLLTDEQYASQKCPNMNFKSYVTAITDYADKYDLIIIDGRARVACLHASLPYLSQRGLIVFDNSDRARYQNALLHSGLTLSRSKGKIPCSPFTGETAILQKEK